MTVGSAPQWVIHPEQFRAAGAATVEAVRQLQAEFARVALQVDLAPLRRIGVRLRLAATQADERRTQMHLQYRQRQRSRHRRRR